MSRKRRPLGRQPKPVRKPVFTVRADVVKTALELADGDRRRIKVTGTNEVLVLNNPR